ncbi:MAG TPA: hypothetical protein VFQ91_23790 [Bryobacteraceae bacterium]|nr:hypothetical protein [Bryobacteraceae bacterium]
MPSSTRRLVHSATSVPPNRRFYGLDLGHRQDHSALAALDLAWTPAGRCPVTFGFLFDPALQIRHLSRFPLGTPYEQLYRLLEQAIPPRAHQQLVIDAGGPGLPVIERLRVSLGERTQIKPVVITGGMASNHLSGGFTSVPRKALISNIQLLLAARSLHCERDLPGVDRLRDELLGLSAGNSQPVSGQAHDDLAIAVALAAWQAVHDAPELLPETEESQRARRLPSLYGPGRLF